MLRQPQPQLAPTDQPPPLPLPIPPPTHSPSGVLQEPDVAPRRRQRRRARRPRVAGAPGAGQGRDARRAAAHPAHAGQLQVAEPAHAAGPGPVRRPASTLWVSGWGVYGTETSLSPPSATVPLVKPWSTPGQPPPPSLLELLRDWFNPVLGDQLLDHLRHWLEPEDLIKGGPFAWRSGAGPPDRGAWDRGEL